MKKDRLISIEQLDWYNHGIILLINIMRGRYGIDGAVREVFEQWRSGGQLIGEAVNGKSCENEKG